MKTHLEAEQYLEDATNWHSMHSLINPENLSEELIPTRSLVVTYDRRDFELQFGDWVVRYPDGTLHFFAKDTFDRLFINPLAEPVSEAEMSELLEAAR